MSPGNSVDETVFKQISVLVIKISERPQLLVIKTAPSILTLGYLVSDRSLLEVALKKIWLIVRSLVGEVAEPFQYSQVADLKRIDIVCFVPDKGEQLKEMKSDKLRWAELELLPYGPVLRLGLKALQTAYSFKNYVSRLANEQDIAWQDAQKAVLFNAEVSGVVKADLVAPRMTAVSVDSEGVNITWASILQNDARALKMLSQAIDRRIADSTDLEEKVIWADWRILLIPLPSVDLPEKIVEEAHHYMDAHLATLPMVDRCPIDVTEWRELPPAQLAPLGFKPQCTADLLTPEAWKTLQEWLDKQKKFCQSMRKLGSDAVRDSKEILALGQSAFVPAAQGVLWDCRNEIPVPLDMRACGKSHLNVPALLQFESTDQELMSFFQNGVSYKADRVLEAMQIVGLPHLDSLKRGYREVVEASLKGLEDKKTAHFFSFHDSVPYLPIRFGSKGLAEGVKLRPTNELGAPRKLTYDTDGIPVWSVNEATCDEGTYPEAQPGEEQTKKRRTTDQKEKWYKENKTQVQDVMRNIAIQKHVQKLVEAVFLWFIYAMGDDAKGFFNQFKTCTEQNPYTTFLIDDPITGNLKFVGEECMTFGPSRASQIGQRKANHLMEMFRSEMDKIDTVITLEEADRCPKLKKWLEDRYVDGKWSIQCRLYFSAMYTDDPIIVALGAERMTRVIWTWETLIRNVGLIMVPSKRSLGTSIQWIGFGILTGPAIIFIPKDKVMKLSMRLLSAIEGKLTFGDYRKMMGLLSHIRYATGRDNRFMFSLWRPLKGYTEPNNLFSPDDEQKAKLLWWAKYVVTVGGTAAIRAVKETVEERVLNSNLEVFTLTTDAHTSEEDGAGLGLYFHGSWSYFEVPAESLGLPISTLEYVACVWGIKTVTNFILNIATGAFLHTRVDAIASFHSITKESQKSILLQAVHQALVELPLFEEISRVMAASHIAGLANIFADKASRRKKHHEMFDLAAILGIDLNHLETDEVWLTGLLKSLSIRHKELLSQEAAEHKDEDHFANLTQTNQSNSTSGSNLAKRLREEDNVKVRSGLRDRTKNPVPMHERGRNPECVAEKEARLRQEARLRETDNLDIFHDGETTTESYDAELLNFPSRELLIEELSVNLVFLSLVQKLYLEGLGRKVSGNSDLASNLASHVSALEEIRRVREKLMQLSKKQRSESQVNPFEFLNGFTVKKLGPLTVQAFCNEKRLGIRSDSLCVPVRPLESLNHLTVTKPEPLSVRVFCGEKTRGLSGMVRSSSLSCLTSGVKRLNDTSREDLISQKRLCSVEKGTEVKINLQQVYHLGIPMAKNLPHPTQSLFEILKKDKSKFAICNTEMISGAILRNYALESKAKNVNVAKTHVAYWNRWVEFCTLMKTQAIRSDAEANSGRDRDGYARECALLSAAFDYGYEVMKGRRTDHPNPASVRAWIAAVRTIHKEMIPSVKMIEMEAVQNTFKALLVKFQLDYSVLASLNQRKEPFTNAHIMSIINLWTCTENNGKKINQLTIRVGTGETLMFATIFQLLLETGFRASEITNDAWDVRRISRGSVTFQFKGMHVRYASRNQLMTMKEGDFIILQPPISKSDQFGKNWGAKPIFLPFFEGRAYNAAQSLRDLELDNPIKDEERSETPLFIDAMTKKCLKSNRLRSMLKATLLTFMSEIDAFYFSVHSFRITLGCKLLAAGVDELTIRSMVRWQSISSLVIYCRMTPEDYARQLAKALKADAKSVQTTTLHDVGLREDLEADEAEARQRGREFR